MMAKKDTCVILTKDAERRKRGIKRTERESKSESGPYKLHVSHVLQGFMNNYFMTRIC